MPKLGKAPPKVHPKTLQLKKYLTGALPTPASKVYREYKTPAEAIQMYGNDEYGDCTCAGAANLLILATCHTGDVVIPTLEEVLALYTKVSGFDPGPPPTNDNGAAMTDVLNELRTNGLSGHKILAWAQIDHTNLQHRKIACDLFGATYVGVQLPYHAQDQFSNNQPWEVVQHDSIEGGHAIVRTGYGAAGDNYVTWAKWDQKANAAWSAAYVDEEYVLITEDWINKATELTPGGISLTELEEDINLL